MFFTKMLEIAIEIRVMYVTYSPRISVIKQCVEHLDSADIQQQWKDGHHLE